MKTPHTKSREARIRALAQLLSGACEEHDHSDALSALLSVYRHLALQHPCCHDSCIKLCLDTVAQLAHAQVAGTAPPGAKVH